VSPFDHGTIVKDPRVLDHSRFLQMFPVLTEAEVDRFKRLSAAFQSKSSAQYFTKSRSHEVSVPCCTARTAS
jgi:hypothetical protein